MTLVAVVFIKEVPLRTTVGRSPEAAPVATSSVAAQVPAAEAAEAGETGEAASDPTITFRELQAADDGHLPRHAAADREGFGHRNGPPDTPRSGDALAARVEDLGVDA